MLAIVTCHFNPSGYAAPVANLHAFLDGLAAQKLSAHVFVGVCTFGGQALPELNVPKGVTLIPFVSDSILWQKEALLNAVVAKLPAKYTKVAILDADILLPDGWYDATSKALDDYDIIQPWSRVTILGDAGESVGVRASVGAAITRGDNTRANRWECYHPGYAWAMRRTFWTKGPGLYAEGIIGLSDGLLALAVTGLTFGVLGHPQTQMLSIAMREDIRVWSMNVFDWQECGLGSIKADIVTLPHGSRANRRYMEHQAILADFDPESDIEHPNQSGPLEWSESARENKWPMIQACADYFGQRLEDKPVIEPDPEADPVVYPEPEPENLDTAEIE